MRKTNCILIIVAILGILFAFSIFNKEGIAINVNSKNKDLVYQSLNGKIENTDNITKIILGQGWNSGKLTIYHSFEKKETLAFALPVLLFFYILIECLNLIHSIMYPLPTFVVIKFSSPAASSFLRSRVTLTVRVFSST